METSDLDPQATWYETPLSAPVCAPTCRCENHDVMASRDEDGDWMCCACGRAITASVTTLRAVDTVVRDLELRAA